MARMRMIKLTWLLSAVCILLAAGCAYVVRKVDVEELDPQSRVVVESPIKAHLRDGTIAVFPDGGRFTSDSLLTRGSPGTLYSLTLARLGLVEGISLDEAAAFETFKTETLPGESLVLSAMATAGAAVVVPVIWVAIFESCPTVYSPGADSLILEAELFSNSIAPLFEMRDVDWLNALPDDQGKLELEIRNEALETHYINHLELLEVVHGEQEVVMPGPGARALVLRDFIVPPSLTDRAGRDVSAGLQAADGQVYRTADSVLDEVRVGDLRDYVDLVLPAPDTSEVAVYMRLKNSLLNTVVFYDYMLGVQGAHALDWLGKGLETVSGATELGYFHNRQMGLRVQVWERGAFREVGRIKEVGPIAWSEVGIVVPVPPGDSLRVRLSFVADAWRIDQVAVAARFGYRPVRALPVRRLVDAWGTPTPEALQQVHAADTEYLTTFPGTRFRVEFDAGPAPAGRRRSFLLAAQGYYTEWIRTDWVRKAEPGARFVASEETLFRGIQKWMRVKDAFEQQFEVLRVPVR